MSQEAPYPMPRVEGLAAARPLMAGLAEIGGMAMDTAVLRSAATALAVGVMLAGCASNPAPSGNPGSAATTAWDGLVRRDSRRVDELYVRPDVTIGPYTSVIIDRTEVAFDRDWDPNRDTRELSRRLSTADMDRIRSDLAQMLNDTFVRELTAGGYGVVTMPGPDTLRISPSIVDLYVNAPDVMAPGRSQTFVMDAGRMTLVAEFRDAHTGQLLARAVDTRRGTDFGHLQIANSVTNSAEAQRAISAWARTLRQGLDALKESAP